MPASKGIKAFDGVMGVREYLVVSDVHVMFYGLASDSSTTDTTKGQLFDGSEARSLLFTGLSAVEMMPRMRRTRTERDISFSVNCLPHVWESASRRLVTVSGVTHFIQFLHRAIRT